MGGLFLARAWWLSVLMSVIATGFTSIAQYGWGRNRLCRRRGRLPDHVRRQRIDGFPGVTSTLFQTSPATPSESREVSTQDISSRLAEGRARHCTEQSGLQEVRTKAEMSTQDMAIYLTPHPPHVVE